MSIHDELRDLRVSVGKYRRLQHLSDDQGRFAMLAIDQRRSLRKLIAQKSGQSAADVSNDALALIKTVVTSGVAPLATAVLTDPLHGYPNSPDSIPPNVGLLLALEVTGYEASDDEDRLSRLIDDWSARKISDVGADAVKLLLWHRHDASDQTLRHQDELVERVGADCRDVGLPFVLEIVTYPLAGQHSGSAEYATVKPEIVIDAAERYSQRRFDVDLLKVEFPGNLKYVEEYQARPFGAGVAAYSLADVQEYCRRLDAASDVPWVILSAGVDPDEFVENLQLANAAGASGFLCGRAVWKDVIDYFPDEAAMRRFAESTARDNFTRIRNANSSARPWTMHPRFANGPMVLHPRKQCEPARIRAGTYR